MSEVSMKRIFNIASLALVFGGLLYPAFAEPPEFNVLAANGKPLVKKSGGKWHKLSAGDKLFKNDVIKISKDSYLGMVHSSGRTKELTSPGTYDVSKLSKEVASKKNSLTKRIADFVFSEISDADDLLSSYDYHEYMDLTGAVERAVGNDVDAYEKIENMAGTDHSLSSNLNESGILSALEEMSRLIIRLPRSSYLIDPAVNFSWYKNPDAQVYTFSLTDRFNNVIYEKNTSDTSLSLNLDDVGIEKGKCYYWHVSSGGSKSDEQCIYRMEDRMASEIDDSLKVMRKGFGKHISPVDCLIMASFYEEFNIMNKADDAYQKALELAPQVDDFKKLYALYLRRIGLIGEASNLMR